MGLNLSKRIKQTLSKTPAFTSACAATFARSLSVSQHSRSFLLPYQLHPASLHLHSILSSPPTLPLLSRWAPPPPTVRHVDRALRRVYGEYCRSVDEAGFERFAVELFGGMVVEEMVGRVVVRRGVVGVGGIVGVGMVAGSGVQAVGRVVGVYALGVAASLYLTGLS